MLYLNRSPPRVLLLSLFRPIWSPKPVRPLNSSAGDEAGLRSVMVFVEGESAYGWLRSEAGVHRLVRNSPYDPTGRRHTSFSQVRVFPEADTGSGEKLKRIQEEEKSKSYNIINLVAFCQGGRGRGAFVRVECRFMEKLQ